MSFLLDEFVACVLCYSQPYALKNYNSALRLIKPQPLISRLLGGEKYLRLYLLYYADVQSRQEYCIQVLHKKYRGFTRNPLI